MAHVVPGTSDVPEILLFFNSHILRLVLSMKLYRILVSSMAMKLLTVAAHSVVSQKAN